MLVVILIYCVPHGRPGLSFLTYLGLAAGKTVGLSLSGFGFSPSDSLPFLQPDENRKLKVASDKSTGHLAFNRKLPHTRKTFITEIVLAEGSEDECINCDLCVCSRLVTAPSIILCVQYQIFN